jgi:hypothetical protein
LGSRQSCKGDRHCGPHDVEPLLDLQLKPRDLLVNVVQARDRHRHEVIELVVSRRHGSITDDPGQVREEERFRRRMLYEAEDPVGFIAVFSGPLRGDSPREALVRFPTS